MQSSRKTNNMPSIKAPSKALLRPSMSMAPIIIIPMLLFSAVRATPITTPITTTSATTTPPLNTTLQEDLQLFANITRGCTSRDCDEQLNLQHLLTLQSHMNPAADPCTNFHDYACGSWNRLHPNNTAPLEVLDQRMLKVFVELFERWRQEDENEVSPTQSNEVRDKILKYYKVCRGLEQKPLTMKSYLQPLRDLTSLWHGQHFDWLITLAELGRLGYTSHFLRYEGMEDETTSMRDSEQLFVLQLLPHDENTNMTWNELIYAALAEHTDKESTQLEKELKEFESKLLTIVAEDDVSNKGYVWKNAPSIREDFFGWVDWLLRRLNYLEDDSEWYLRELKAELGSSIDISLYLTKLLVRSVGPTEKILVRNMSTIKKLFDFLEQSDSETLRLYTTARFLDYLQSQYNASVLDASTPGNSLNCINHMNGNLKILLSYLYDREYYDELREQDEAIIEDVFNSLREEFKLILQQNIMQLGSPEMDYLVEKIDSMSLKLGEVPVNATPSHYNDYVRNWVVGDTDFSYNHLRSLEHYYGHQISVIGMDADDLLRPLNTYFHNTAIPEAGDASSPFYNIIRNAITLPFGYLQLPFYSKHFWDTLLYGELANTLGHEIIHGFDSSGLQYDGRGRTRSSHRWIMSNSKFRENIACLDNNTEFLDERIADVSGTHLALRTFMKQVEAKSRSGRLFFLQFAQFFCGAQDEDAFREDDPSHDMHNVRLNYILAQTPEFAENFGCPVGSPLNPEARCHLW